MRPRRDAFRDLRRPQGGDPSGRIPLGGILLANKLRDKGSNLDLHVQSVVSCRLDDPGTVGVSIHVPRRERRCSCGPLRARSRPVSRRPYAERCCPSHSPTLRPWITDRRMRNPGWPTSYVEGLWSPSLAHVPGNSQAKAEANDQPPFRPPCGRSLSPSGGASIRSRLSQAEHHLSVVSVGHLLETTKATRWVALDWLGMPLDS